MSRPGRVTWSEGMALDPHHFQQWDRHHLAVLQARLRCVAPLAWGLTELQLDEEAIANGTLRLTRCARNDRRRAALQATSGTGDDSLVLPLEDVFVSDPDATHSLVNVLHWAHWHVAPIVHVELYE